MSSPNTAFTAERPAIDSERSDLEAGQAAERGLDRLRHELLDLLGREARCLGLDVDLGRDEVGEHVELGVLRRPDARRRTTSDGDREHEAAAAQGRD